MLRYILKGKYLKLRNKKAMTDGRTDRRTDGQTDGHPNSIGPQLLGWGLINS